MDENKVIRKCLSCGARKPRTDLIKITINKKTKELKVNPDYGFQGYSVYLCKDMNCVNLAFKKGRILKILKIKQDESLKEKIGAVLER